MLIAIFKEHGLVIELSMKEVEAAFDGRPLGRQPIDFLGKWILFIDEFGTVKGELKMLNSSLRGAPKNQMTFEIDLYMKVLASAEQSDSLTGSGVEQQFSRRINLLHVTNGCIDDRPLFKTVGRTSYLQSLVNYVGQRLNQMVEEYRRLGRIKVANHADKVLEEYNQEHNIGRYFGSLDDAITDIATDLKRLIIENMPGNIVITDERISQFLKTNAIKVKYKERDALLVKNVRKLISDYLGMIVSKGEVAKVAYKTTDIRRLLEDSDREDLNSAIRVLVDGKYSQAMKGVLIYV